MKKMWMMLLLGFLLAGCGTGDKVSNNEPDKGIDAGEEKESDQVVNGGGKGIVAGEMAANLIEKSPLVFQYEVKNQTEEEVKLEFTSSQRFDYSVKTMAGEEILLFSSLANFLQALGEETVKQGESLSYEIDLHDMNLQKGEYTLTVWMTPMGGKKYTMTKEFIVE
jgi:hypothetical protein